VAKIPNWYFNEEWHLNCPEMSVEDAIFYHNKGLQPFEAFWWQEEEFMPAYAEGWIDNAFSPREARGWADAEVEPWQAAKLRNDGMSIIQFLQGECDV